MNNRPTTFHLPSHLPFPITISSFLVKPDSPIKKHDGLLVYKFFTYVSEDQNDREEEKQVKKEMVEQFDSPWEGILTEWLVEEGTVVSSARYITLPFMRDYVDGIVSLFSRLLNLVYMKFHSRTFALFVELIYQGTTPDP
jgi:hypothetical protein